MLVLPAVVIRGATAAAGMTCICNHHVTRTIVTFEEEPVRESEIAERVGEIRSMSATGSGCRRETKTGAPGRL